MRARALILFLLVPVWAWAQGFAGLGTQADDGFAMPDQARALQFPADHGAHPTYRIEWWYVTATLEEVATGAPLGVQWTLFRSALAPGEADGWDSPQIWFAHAALTDADRHLHAQRFARGGIGHAGVTADPFEAWINEWQLISLGGTDPLDQLRMTAQGARFAYDLTLTADGPLVLQGEGGYSVKSEAGQASYYYSQPFYQVTGTVTRDGVEVAVTGQAWLDREWSSQPLSPDQTGWDWFSLTFTDDSRMMGFALRNRDGSAFTSATWIEPDGQAIALPPGALQVAPLRQAQVAGREVPVEWALRLPDYDVNITVRALNDQAWNATLFPYWEGPIEVQGSHQGRGYLEMTGYD